MLFGAHVSAAGGISKAIDRIEEIGGNAVQVFTQSPRMWKPTQHAPEELERFRARRRQARVRHVSCHALYLVNLASRDRAIRKKSFEALTATMETAREIEADAVVFHVGSHLGYGFGDAVKKVTPALRELLELTTDDLWLCLENAAGAGGTIGRSVGELAALCDALDGHRRLGVCLDSCHWWASGVDVTDAEALDDALDELDSTHRARASARPPRQRLEDRRSARTAIATTSSREGSSATGSRPSSDTRRSASSPPCSRRGPRTASAAQTSISSATCTAADGDESDRASWSR